MAAKLLAEHYAGWRVAVHSRRAPSRATRVHPEVATVLAERGLDASQERPAPFDPDGVYDVVVTMGCGDTCPVYRGARYEDWPLDDPKGQDLVTVRRIVDEIDLRVRALLQDLASE